MTLRELTSHLQTLCHEGFSNEEVIARLGGFGTSINSVHRELHNVNDENGSHEEHIVVLGA